jgi:integrase
MKVRKRLGLREVRALKPGEYAWDAIVHGFCARRQKGPHVVYWLSYRDSGNRSRWHRIGVHGSPWGPDTARTEAQRKLGAIASGADPAADRRAARNALKLADLCADYLRDADAGVVLGRGGQPKRASTLAMDRSRIALHILPALGHRTVASIKREDIARLMHEVAQGRTGERRRTKPRGVSIVRGGRTAATRVVGLLGGIFTYAIERGLVTVTPCRGIRRYADRKRDRRLTEDEYARLGEALRKLEATGLWPPAIGAIRFLSLTGWRRGEALGVPWQNLDLPRRTAILPTTKTGRSTRPLSHAACDVLRTMLPLSNPLAFPASRGDGAMDGLLQVLEAGCQHCGASLRDHAACPAALLRIGCGRSRLR